MSAMSPSTRSAPPCAGALSQVLAAFRNLAIGVLRCAGEPNIAAATRRCAAQPWRALALLGIPRE